MGFKVVMATWAYHDFAGDISRDDPDYANAEDETATHYIGNWITGMGFINVRFPKDGCREMTPEETEYLATHPVVIN